MADDTSQECHINVRTDHIIKLLKKNGNYAGHLDNTLSNSCGQLFVYNASEMFFALNANKSNEMK